MLDTIDFASLDPWHATPASNWEAAVETLMLSLAKHNVAILKVPPQYSDQLNEGMRAVAGLTMEETTDPDVAMPEEALPQPEPYLFRDPSPRRNPSSPGLVQAHPGKLVCEHLEALPVTHTFHIPLHMCNKALERTARGVLQALCRSCHMRLHTSTFLGLLEDLPLRENARSCSTLQAVKYVRTSSEAGPSNGPPLAWPLVQEGITPPGFVMVTNSQPAQDPDRECAVSKLQVKDRSGTWIDVPLKQDEVAVFLGKTAEVASSGLLKASTYRLVGELQKGSGHQNVEFHLCARPGANLDLSKQLEAAGHHLPERHADRDGMNDLVRQFSAVLTPQNQTPPNRIPGRGSASTGGSLEMHTIPSTELKNRSRKRVSGEVGRAPSPVTRSGKVARTSTGLVNREHRLRGRGSGPSDEAEPFTEQDGALQGDAEAEEVLCVTVDGQGAHIDRLYTLRMIYETTRTEVALRTHRKTSLARLFEVFCNTVGANLSTVKFMHNGERLSGSHTCRQLCDIDQPIIVSDVDC